MTKFRAWLKSVGEMVEVLGIDFYNKEVAYIWTEQVSDYELEQTREYTTTKYATECVSNYEQHAV